MQGIAWPKYGVPTGTSSYRASRVNRAKRGQDPWTGPGVSPKPTPIHQINPLQPAPASDARDCRPTARAQEVPSPAARCVLRLSLPLRSASASASGSSGSASVVFPFHPDLPQSFFLPAQPHATSHQPPLDAHEADPSPIHLILPSISHLASQPASQPNRQQTRSLASLCGY